jgi:hypothetical protein
MAVAINFVVCEDVRADPTNLHRVNLYGISGFVRPRGRPAYPYYMPRLTTFLLFTEPEATETIFVQVVRADTGAVVARNQPRTGTIGGGPDQILGLLFNIRDCPFPVSGLYWVECWANGKRIARQRFYARV